MPSLTLRDVPESLHRWLKQQADAHHRSVNKEVISLLEGVSGAAPTPKNADERRAAIDVAAAAP
ncbi:MAG: Arc family DNA-binding protein [Betaproteobacteria bacterium]|nr:Arc family DNA-binding protein [Betaproteobacteria bacterium]